MSMITSSAPTGLTGRHVFLILLAFFGTIAAADAFLVWSAIQSWTGAETTSAYRAGQLYGGEFARARAQAALGWRLDMAVERKASGAALVRVTALDAAGAALAGRKLTATLQRPTDKRADRSVDLAEGRGGLYTGELAELSAGQWDLVVEVQEQGALALRRKIRLVLR